MKGLLLKDWYQMRRYCRAYLFLLVVFLALSVFDDDAMFLLYPCVLGGMMPITLQAYDEKEKWEQYAGGLPVSRAQLVAAKYLIGFAVAAALGILTALAQCLRMGLVGSVSASGLLAAACLPFASLLVPALILPFIFRYGVEKGRIAYYVAVGVVCGGAVFITTGANAAAGVQLFSGAALPVAAVISLAGYALSWAISVRCYAKREL